MKYSSGVFVVTSSEDVKVGLYNNDTIARNFRVVFYSVLNNTPLTILQDSGTVNLAAQEGFHEDLSGLSGSTDVLVEISVDSNQIVPVLAVIPSATGLPRYWQAPSDFKKFE